ncbi:PREDICTED: chymotrypsin inhibitor [Rhagoletis zephyria]|uniref:chymotrypsin inhibitor n=1 Tax=Rhagoletis zephyria TaxID=28612 RepID=UPI000811393F|nr:PREDICTED: chymotrypsin inhibitor [Rhagoletis zephyria]
MGKKVCLILLFTFLSLVTKAAARPQGSDSTCGPNANFTNCGTACPSKCSDNPLLGTICTDQCVVGCQCKDGYVLNDAGKCVQRSEC